MEAVKVLTIEVAAKRLEMSRYAAAQMLMRGELTTATVDDRPAVLVDLTFRRMERKAKKAVAA